MNRRNMSIPNLMLFTAGLTALVLCFGTGCHKRPDGPVEWDTPENIRLSINGGATATRDTLLVVSVYGDGIDQMLISDDSTLMDAIWEPYDTLVYRNVPSVEGRVYIYGRFTSGLGGTTEVVRDDIRIDLSAAIATFNILAASDTIHAGNAITFEVTTGEPGRVEVSLGDAISGYRLTHNGNGYFRRSLTMPNGIIADTLVPVAHFRDEVGNVAEPMENPSRITIRGEPFEPEVIGSFYLRAAIGMDIWTHRGYCFVSDQNQAVHVLDANHPANINYVRFIPTGDWSDGMSASNGLLFVADGDAGVAVIGMNPPVSSALIGRALVLGKARDVTTFGDWVYVACEYTGFWILDARDWARPTVLGQESISGYGEAITHNGTMVYMTGVSGLAIVDAHIPADPVVKSEILIEGEPQELVYHEDRLYVATRDRGIVIIDVTDPANPIQLEERTDLRPAHSVALQPPHLFVGRSNRVTVLSVAAADALPTVADIGGLVGVRGMFVEGEQLYIAGTEWIYVVSLFDGQ